MDSGSQYIYIYICIFILYLIRYIITNAEQKVCIYYKHKQLKIRNFILIFNLKLDLKNIAVIHQHLTRPLNL